MKGWNLKVTQNCRKENCLGHPPPFLASKCQLPGVQLAGLEERDVLFIFSFCLLRVFFHIYITLLHTPKKSTNMGNLRLPKPFGKESKNHPIIELLYLYPDSFSGILRYENYLQGKK